MTLDDVHRYLLEKPSAVEDRPFDPDVPVFKVGGKMFAYTIPSRRPPWLTIKCDPFHAELLCEAYAAVRPGYHTNKRHWITVVLDGSVPGDELRDWIDESYDLVVAGLPRRARETLVSKCGKGREGR